MNSRNRCMTRSMESCTAWRVVRDLMLDAVPASSRSWPRTSCILRSGGTYRLISSVPRPSFRASCSRVRLNLNLATESDADKTELVTGYSTSSQKKQGRWPTVLGRLFHILDFFFLPGLCFAHVLHILLTSPQEKQVGFTYKMLFPRSELSDYSLSLQFVLEACLHLSQPDPLVRVFVPRYLAGLEIIV